VIIPHLVFSHLVADYLLQTNWLAERKAGFVFRDPRTWDGMLLHISMVWLVSLAVLPEYIGVIWPQITILALVHMSQDMIKAWTTEKLPIPTALGYFVDQALHLLAIVIFQVLVGQYLTPPPDALQIRLLVGGIVLIVLTRFYEVSWWANWPAMYSYMSRWRLWSYTERCTILVLSLIGVWWLAPLAVLPRVYIMRRQGEPIEQQPNGLLELLLGMALSVILGLAL
jgi:hypothetical protein